MIQRWKKQINTKKVVTFLVIVFLCILPLIISSLYVHYYDYIYHSNHFSVALYDKDEAELVFEEGSPETAVPGSMVDLFYQLNNKKSPLSKPTGDPDIDDFILAKLELNGTPTELKCYFSTTREQQGYCIDQTGKIYTIPSDINDLFLLSDYGELFYSNANIPTLTTIDGDRILPSNVIWHYQAVDGEYLIAKNNEITETKNLYEITGTIGIQFDSQPDICTISIVDSKGNTLKKDCSLDDLRSVAVDTGSRLTMQIKAEWIASEECDYYGIVNYNFEIKLRNPSTFAIQKTTITAGEFLLISCTNISNPSRIKLLVNDEERAINFIWDGTVARGILPISKNTPEQKINLQVSYGASKQDFQVTVEKASAISLSKPDWGDNLRLNQTTALHSLLTSLASFPSTPFYFRGNFLDPTADGFELEYAHESTILYGESQKPFIPYGTEFVTDQTGEVRVKALNHGTVILTGFDKSIGNFVVVDHGGGLRTIYGALDTISVEVSETVQKGEAIGKASEKTRSGKKGFLLLCTVDTTLIDPSYILGKKVSFPI